MLGKLSIIGAVAAILMIPTALSAQMGGSVNSGYDCHGQPSVLVGSWSGTEGRHRVEAAWLALCLQPLAALGQEQEHPEVKREAKKDWGRERWR